MSGIIDRSVQMRRLKEAENAARGIVGPLLTAREEAMHAVNGHACDAAIVACLKRAEKAIERTRALLGPCYPEAIK